MNDQKLVLFNFFDVIAMGIIVGFGALAIFTFNPQSAPGALGAFLLGASVPVGFFFLLGRIASRHRPKR